MAAMLWVRGALTLPLMAMPLIFLASSMGTGVPGSVQPTCSTPETSSLTIWGVDL